MSADEWVGIRVWMQDRRKFQADATAVAASVDNIDKKTARLGDTQDKTTRKTWLMNRALFTVRRVVYGFTLAIGAAAAAVGFLGFRFNMMLETARVSFTVLLGDAKLANREIETLFQLAATTPFDFANIQMAARQLLNFGFSLDETNRYLKTFSDVVAGFGGDVTIIERIARALGQMRTKGRVFQEELRQLQEAGVPATRYLMEQLGLTQDQIANIGRLRLRSDYGIEAIIRGLETDPKFKGAAAALQKTVQGRLTTISDYSNRLFGRILLRPFQMFRRELRMVEYRLKVLDKVMKNKGFTAMVARLDQMVGAGGRLSAVWLFLMMVGTALAIFFTQTLIPALKLSSEILGPILIPLFYLLGHALLFAAQHSSILKYALAGLIVYLTLTRLWMIKVWATAKLLFLGSLLLRAARYLKSLALGFAILRGAGLGWVSILALMVPNLARLGAALQSMYLVMKLVFLTNLANKGLIPALWVLLRQLAMLPFWFFASTKAGQRLIAMFLLMSRVIKAGIVRALMFLAVALRSTAIANFLLTWSFSGLAIALRAAAVSMALFLLTNPVGWALLAISALTILYFRWEAFRNLVNDTFSWFLDNWSYIRFALLSTVVGPIVAAVEAIRTLIRYWDVLASKIDSVRGKLDWANRLKGPSGIDLIKKIPGLASGGTVRMPGWSVVGEQGPEMLWMGQGATVIPLPDLGRMLQPNVVPLDATAPRMGLPEYEFKMFSTPVNVFLDKKQVGESVAEFRLEVRARS